MGTDQADGKSEHDITGYLQSLDWSERTDHWWSVLHPLGADPEVLERVDEEAMKLDELPRWAIEVRQQIRDFSPCHYSFPHALELLLEGVGNETPDLSFRGCRSISDSRRDEAKCQAGILQKWVVAKGRVETPSSREDQSPDVNPREMLTTLGKASKLKLSQLKRLLTVLSRERKKGGGMKPFSLNGWKLQQPCREPPVCDQGGCGCVASASGNGNEIADNPVCHFKYFLFVNFNLTRIGTDGRKIDVLSRRAIEREYKNRLSQIRYYLTALDQWLASAGLARAVQSDDGNGDQVRKVYALLGRSTPAKRWLVASIRETLAIFGEYFRQQVVPHWDMSCAEESPATVEAAAEAVPADDDGFINAADDDHFEDDD